MTHRKNEDAPGWHPKRFQNSDFISDSTGHHLPSPANAADLSGPTSHTVRLSLGELHTIREGGALWVVFRPAVEALNLNVQTQIDKLRTRSWACLPHRGVQLPGDRQTRNMVVVDRRTFIMWLAGINESKVDEAKRPLLVAFQSEAADALDRYFYEGEAINPRRSGTEVVPHRQVSNRELARMVLEEADRADAAEHRALALEPAAEAWGVLATAEGDYSLRDAGFMLNRDPSITTGQNRLMKSLRSLGMVDRRGVPYAAHSRHLVERTISYKDPHTGEPKLSNQLRITVLGLQYLHKKLGGTAPLAENALADR